MLLLCSAARALARKLAEEKQAAINAAKNAAEHSMDEEELEAIKQSVEQATADAAREAARADALARAARQQGPSASSHLQDLERLKVCVSSLQACVFVRGQFCNKLLAHLICHHLCVSVFLHGFFCCICKCVGSKGCAQPLPSGAVAAPATSHA